MLVLSRKTGESIFIADNIEVTVIEVRNGKVRLGFRCPGDVSVLRKEVYDREAGDNQVTPNGCAAPPKG
jgi:carbon storage regulator